MALETLKSATRSLDGLRFVNSRGTVSWPADTDGLGETDGLLDGLGETDGLGDSEALGHCTDGRGIMTSKVDLSRSPIWLTSTWLLLTMLPRFAPWLSSDTLLTTNSAHARTSSVSCTSFLPRSQRRNSGYSTKPPPSPSIFWNTACNWV